MGWCGVIMVGRGVITVSAIHGINLAIIDIHGDYFEYFNLIFLVILQNPGICTRKPVKT